MNNLVFDSEGLNRIMEGGSVPAPDVLEIYHRSLDDPGDLFLAAQNLSKRFKGNTVTFSKKVFFNIVNLCRDTCTYCTYKAEPDEKKLSMMSRLQVRELLVLAKRYRCTEALYVTGERPEQRYEEARNWLKGNGFNTTAEYLIYCSEAALEMGLFPHTNAGNLNYKEMKELKKTNVSMGVMLENASPRLSEKAMPHHLAPSKRPRERLEVLENSGRLGIPMTTGILVGIGETIQEVIDSLFAIKRLDDRYSNIQEIILQNFHPKPDTGMNNVPSADEAYFKLIVAISRIIMPRTNIQIPPNLSPGSYHDFLSLGINDWGGISPLTPDFVNPEFAWPEIGKVEENTNIGGFELKCRFPAYPEYHSMVGKELRDRMAVIKDEDGFVREEYWR